jgi:glutamate-ammonia-ligase adenylyltransferase
MRQRMREELGKGTDEWFDLKQDRGGVTDIEFIVQYLVLREAHDKPDLVEFPDNIRQLESLVEYQILIAEDANTLANAYRIYRRQMHHLALAGKSALVKAADVADLAENVTEVWLQVFGSGVSQVEH